MSDYMNIEEFRSKHQYYVNLPHSKEKQQAKLAKFLHENRLRLPLYRQDRKIQLPEFNHTKYVKFQDTYYSSKKYLRSASFTGFVDIDKCVGSTWLFRNDRSEDRPDADRLAKCLIGSPEDYPPFPADRCGDWYNCIDGNHRIYAAFLLGYSKVKVICSAEYTSASLVCP